MQDVVIDFFDQVKNNNVSGVVDEPEDQASDLDGDDQIIEDVKRHMSKENIARFFKENAGIAKMFQLDPS